MDRYAKDYAGADGSGGEHEFRHTYGSSSSYGAEILFQMIDLRIWRVSWIARVKE